MAQAQSADAACWEAELAETLDGMYTPWGYLYPTGLLDVKRCREGAFEDAGREQALGKGRSRSRWYNAGR